MNSRCGLLCLPAVIMAFAALSCSRPATAEQFVRNADRDVYGRYVFDVDMSDSLAAYDISLLSSFSCIDRDFAPFVSMPLHLLWESPEGQCFEDNVVLPGSALKDSSYYDKVLSDCLGEGLVPERAGLWKLYVTAPEDSLKKYGMTGMGIRVDRKTKHEDGTR